MPGIGVEMLGAMQQAAQPERQSMEQGLPKTGQSPIRRWVKTPPSSVGASEPASPPRYYAGVTPTHIMKLSVPTLVTILALGGAVAFQTGCAGTATRTSTGEYIDDTATTAKVKAAFVKDPLVKALDVNVDTFRGTVQLSGFVDNAEQKARAEEVARTVQGVTTVKNNLALKASTAR
jgi:hypothetical protein